MYLEPFPPWSAADRGRLLHIEPKSQTPHHTLGLQHYEVPVKNAQGEVIEWKRHTWDMIVPKSGFPGLLDEKEWERVMEAPEELEGMKNKRVVRVRYRHKITGVVVSREVAQWHPHIFRGGVLMKPFIRYPDGTGALLYLEEWRSTSGKVEIMFPEGMIDILPSGASQAPLNSAIPELWEEAGIKTTHSSSSSSTSPSGSIYPHSLADRRLLEPVKDNVTLTLLDQERIEHGLMGMGQERWMFRVAVYGLEKGIIPEPRAAETNELIRPRIVPIDKKLKHHFERYTEENGYLINPQMTDEIERIMASL